MRIEPFSRTILSVFSSAHPVDFKEHEWLLRHGETETWYQKPRPHELKELVSGEHGGSLIPPPKDARPACLEFPKTWASAALTTPMDDDVYDCEFGHDAPDTRNACKDCIGKKCVATDTENTVCTVCTDEKCEALESTPLTYRLVFTTTNVGEKECSPHCSCPKTTGEKIFRLVKCGSRQAAIAEVFYATGVNGWSLSFSCVTRDDEELSESVVRVQRVEELWQLGEEQQQTVAHGKTVRVFY